jgi:twinkle protein
VTGDYGSPLNGSPQHRDKDWSDFNIVLTTPSGDGEFDTTCPQCSPHRKNKNARCLSGNTIHKTWSCHHCGWSGSLKSGQRTNSDPLQDRPKTFRLPASKDYNPEETLQSQLYEWFERRGIPRDIVDRYKIVVGDTWCPYLEDRAPTLQVPYYRNGEMVNVKYRRLRDKQFWMVSSAERVLYGLDDIIPGDDIIFVEGEFDKLAFATAGIDNVLSVPDGAPAPNSKNYASKFSFLGDPYFEERLDKAKRIIIAVDADEPGRILGDELARRFESDRCWRLTWPQGIKDANEALLQLGPAFLERAIDDAAPWPVSGILSPDAEKLDDFYEHGLPTGLRLDWELDKYWRPYPGFFTLFSGPPHSGTSTLLSNIAVRCAAKHGWRWGICSPEFQPYELLWAELMSIKSGKPFVDGPTPRMSKTDVETLREWVEDHFFVIDPEPVSLEEILARGKVLARRYGIKGLIIDPWSELEHRRNNGENLTDYIQRCNADIRRFGRKHGVAMMERVHPTKLIKGKDGEYEEVEPYDMAGSANWFGQADFILVNRRFMQPENRHLPSEIACKKAKFRTMATLGKVYVHYDPATARFNDARPAAYD